MLTFVSYILIGLDNWSTLGICLHSNLIISVLVLFALLESFLLMLLGPLFSLIKLVRTGFSAVWKDDQK